MINENINMTRIDTEDFFKRPKLEFHSRKWLDGINSKVNNTEGKVSKFEDRAVRNYPKWNTERKETNKKIE